MRYEETDEFPLMAWPGPVLIILASYWLFVLKVGPALMTKREPYKLTGVLVVYNSLQVALSIFMIYSYLGDFLERGFFPTRCYISEKPYRKQILSGIWLYFIAKITELLDTVFFVLRKKYNQVTFLHMYHHSIMVISTWTFNKYWPSHTLYFIGLLNSLVHVFMYTYYALSVLGPNVTKYIFWKKYMTKLQLIQFVIILIHYITAVNISDCPPSRNVSIYVAFNIAFIMLLFLNFYRQSYNQRGVKNEHKPIGHLKIISKAA